MPIIKSIKYRKVLNSHVKFTNEFIIELESGNVGIGCSPEGETISIYEDKNIFIDPEKIIQTMIDDGCIEGTFGQKSFDDYLQHHIPDFGRNNVYGLSLAFFNATKENHSLFDIFGQVKRKLTPPHLCCNILNGGHHAYTNPVLSDFHEYILVAKSEDIEKVCDSYNEVQRVVRERLSCLPKTMVSGNPVNCFPTKDNRECLEFLLKVRDDLGLSDAFDLMIDASAGDLWKDGTYRFDITDKTTYSTDDFCEYWLDLIKQFGLRYLEDPFREIDYDGWRRLTASQNKCFVIGDNLYSTDAEKIATGAAEKLTNGVIIKPNQAGTVSAVQRALEVCKGSDQIAITSHRSISTEDTFLSALTCIYDVKHIKIGPFISDYSSVIRLNAIIRLTGD